MARSGAFDQNRAPFECPRGIEGLQYLLDFDYVLPANNDATITGNGKYFLSPRGASCIGVGHKCSRVGSITTFIRPVESLEDLSTFEMFLKLLQEGWTYSTAPAKSKCQPFTRGADKMFYIQDAMNRSYFHVLLLQGTIFRKAPDFQVIHHLQSKAYYDAILSCIDKSPELMLHIVENKPANFYKNLKASLNPKGRKKHSLHTPAKVRDEFQDESGKLAVLSS